MVVCLIVTIAQLDPTYRGQSTVFDAIVIQNRYETGTYKTGTGIARIVSTLVNSAGTGNACEARSVHCLSRESPVIEARIACPGNEHMVKARRITQAGSLGMIILNG